MENQYRPHELCKEKHMWMGASIEGVSQAMDYMLRKIKIMWYKNLIKSVSKKSLWKLWHFKQMP
jgi:hypothetical protein